ncbi:MAG: ParA family protein [Hyphomicrobiaceae bacterium]
MSINVAIANHKGGVGKSTSTMMIAEGLALFHGRRVLVLDLDPQGMASRMMLSRFALDAAARERRTVMDLLLGYSGGRQGALPYYISPGASDMTELRKARDDRRVDLIPSHPQSLREYRSMEAMLRTYFTGKRLDQELARILAVDLERVSAHYDVVLFDCAAGISPTSLAALRLSSVVLSPTMLERNSIDALVDFLRIILQSDLGLQGLNHQRVYVLMTMFMRSNPSQQLLLDTIQRGIQGLNAIATPISHSPAIQRAVLHPGEGASRLAQEKYGAAFEELRLLASAINDVIEKARGGGTPLPPQNLQSPLQALRGRTN